MRILIDIGHPGHVHLLKNLMFDLQRKGHEIFVTVKDIPSAKILLSKYNIEFLEIGRKKDSLFGKALYQLYYNLKLLKLVRKHHINLGIGSSISIAHVSKLSKMKSIILDDDDDDVQPLFVKYAHPFCDTLLSPESLKGKRKKQGTVFYPGFHELAYLHPNIFKPDVSILDEVELKQGEPFFIMRFNVFKAHHDIGIHGLSLQQKLKLINFLEPYGKIFITTERKIEPELKRYQVKISPEKIHHLMSLATMFLGDSQTMTSEAAVLGIPGIKCNTFAGKLSVPNEIENKYNLCYSYRPEDFDKILEKINDLLSISNLMSEWQTRRQKMLSEKINVTTFMVWFIENYPNSVKIMKENPDYQWKFK